MDNIVEYDKTNPASIEKYAQKLIGKTFRSVWIEDELQRQSDTTDAEELIKKLSNEIENKRNKGKLGQIIEESFFHYACNNDSRPDFPEAGVELKVTPYKINKNGSLSAKERLLITMIDYFGVVNESFETSHFWGKSKLILLIYYLYKKETRYNIDYRISYSKLFTPPDEDLPIIRHDYELIVKKIKAGKAHELSEGDTLYLGATPKGATSKDRKKQPYSDELAKPRAFSYKSSYMTYILRTYIVPGKQLYEPIITNETVDSFEDYVVEKVNKYKGWTVESLCKKFHLDGSKKPKNLEALLAYRILGIKGNHAEEFVKANVVVKSIRLQNNNKMKESMSFPAFKYKELVNEDWEDSTFGNYLRETRFLFVVYKADKENKLHLMGCQFWNIPYKDLEEDVRTVWERTKKVLIDGLEIKVDNRGRNITNFPKQSENRVSHVRPHAKNKKDTYDLPDGRPFPKHCFWLNNKYICSQLNEELKADID